MVADKESHLTNIDAAIHSLQAAIEATRVPGELREWLTRLRHALSQVGRVVSGESLPRHRRDFKEIANDVSLIPKVEQLKAEDQSLLIIVRDLEKLADDIQGTLGKSIDQDEDVVRLKKLSELSHDLVIRLRSQEQAIDTWFIESIQRDEGVSG